MNSSQFIAPQTAATKNVIRWHSNELQQDVTVARWGNFGTPLLLFPTAGGDAEEVERFFLIRKLEPFIHDGRLKVYSADSVNGREWITGNSVPHKVWVQQQYDRFVANELVPLIRRDCQSDQIDVIAAGASVGAFNALNSICRYPHLFSRAICMSGTYDIEKWLEGRWFDEFHHQAPLLYVPGLPDDTVSALQKRFIILATGQGDHESPDESWKVAEVLGQRSIPNRVDLWDPNWPHDWATWREMIPKYIQEALSGLGR